MTKRSVSLLAFDYDGTLQRERERLGCDRAVYVGDNETDEDVFALAPAEELLGVRVGANRGSAARFYIRRQPNINALLRTLVEQRPEGSGE